MILLSLPPQTPHSSVMLSSFRKRRVQVFDQHAEMCCLPGFAWLAVQARVECRREGIKPCVRDLSVQQIGQALLELLGVT